MTTGNGFLFYRLHHAGLFNKLMSFEVALGLAEVTKKKLVIYNSKNKTSKPIDTPSLTSGADLGKRSQIITEKIPSIFDLFYYPKHLIHEVIDLDDIDRFDLNEVVIEGKSLHDRYIVVSPTGDEKEFGIKRDELVLLPGVNYHIKAFTLAAYSRFFCGRTRELDRVLHSVRVRDEYFSFARDVANYIGDFNGIHLRLGDHKNNYNVSPEDFKIAVDSLSDKKVIVLTDELDNEMLQNKNIIFLDDIIVDNFGDQFKTLPNTSEVVYGLVSAIIMSHANRFIGTWGSTFSSYIHREMHKQKDIKFEYIGIKDEPEGSPYSWNTTTLSGYGSIVREWPESRLIL